MLNYRRIQFFLSFALNGTDIKHYWNKKGKYFFFVFLRFQNSNFDSAVQNIVQNFWKIYLLVNIFYNMYKDSVLHFFLSFFVVVCFVLNIYVKHYWNKKGIYIFLLFFVIPKFQFWFSSIKYCPKYFEKFI